MPRERIRETSETQTKVKPEADLIGHALKNTDNRIINEFHKNENQEKGGASAVTTKLKNGKI